MEGKWKFLRLIEKEQETIVFNDETIEIDRIIE